MSTANERRELGMDRRIPRRDFLNGLAVGVTGAYVAATAPTISGRTDAPVAVQGPATAAAYPPARMGLRGNYPAAVDAFTRMQSGTYRQLSSLDVDTGETYDLVIVGGGISGLAAAYFWRRALARTSACSSSTTTTTSAATPSATSSATRAAPSSATAGRWASRRRIPYSYMAKPLVADLGVEVDAQRRVPEPRACSEATISGRARSSTRSISARTAGGRHRAAAVAG